MRVMATRQERRYRRFQLECPVCVKFQAASSFTEVEAISQNVSIGGLLVKSASMIPEHTPVTFIISIQGRQVVYPIYLAGEGKVVRVESRQADAAFLVAVECGAPIKQLEERLRPA